MELGQSWRVAGPNPLAADAASSLYVCRRLIRDCTSEQWLVRTALVRLCTGIAQFAHLRGNGL
jgi:hypothetical protein